MKNDLKELVENNFSKLGGPVEKDPISGKISFTTAGEFVATLTAKTAQELGLTENCAVSSGIIDAYAGWIGTVAASSNKPIIELDSLNENYGGMSKAIGRLAAVAGTSTCHISLVDKPIFVPGVWGPYRDVISQDYWCAEGGQSCTGALLQHVLETHPAYDKLLLNAQEKKIDKFEYLDQRIEELFVQSNLPSTTHLTKEIFFYGDYHGNRSPLSDQNMRANIIGQSMDVSLDNLCLMYLAACEFIAQQTRQIVETMCKAGYQICAIYMSGGQCRNKKLMQLISNCVQIPVVIPVNIDTAVVFGSALMGATAAELKTSQEEKQGDILWKVMTKMTGEGTVVWPESKNSPSYKLLNAKYSIFLDMIETQNRYREIVSGL